MEEKIRYSKAGLKETKALENVYKAIEEFCRQIILKDKNKIEAILLYGSIVKGKYHLKDSDIDIMIVAKDRSIDEDVLDLETIISLKYNVVISALLSTAEEMRKGRRAGYVFFDEVLKGKVLYESGKARAKISL